MPRKKLFCEINPTCYEIAKKKEIAKRHLKNILSRERFARTVEEEKLPCIVSSHSSNLIKRGPGIDPELQENKAVNIRLACARINGTVIHPGEVFSFWGTVGKATRRKGYRDGRILVGGRIEAGTGGGLCNLGNTIHLLVLHSPLDVVEFHQHSDALAPDEGKRVPFSSGTSVCYNSVDYRFQNNTDQRVQLLVWCDEEKLYGELRCEREFPWQYALVEEDHRFQKEGAKYYRRSKIFRQVMDRATGEVIKKELILDNRSEVLYDYDLIPRDQIRSEDAQTEKI